MIRCNKSFCMNVALDTYKVCEITVEMKGKAVAKLNLNVKDWVAKKKSSDVLKN